MHREKNKCVQNKINITKINIPMNIYPACAAKTSVDELQFW